MFAVSLSPRTSLLLLFWFGREEKKWKNLFRATCSHFRSGMEKCITLTISSIQTLTHTHTGTYKCGYCCYCNHKYQYGWPGCSDSCLQATISHCSRFSFLRHSLALGSFSYSSPKIQRICFFSPSWFLTLNEKKRDAHWWRTKSRKKKNCNICCWLLLMITTWIPKSTHQIDTARRSSWLETISYSQSIWTMQPINFEIEMPFGHCVKNRRVFSVCINKSP